MTDSPFSKSLTDSPTQDFTIDPRGDESRDPVGQASELEKKGDRPSLDDQPWVDLRRYDQSDFDRGQPGWMVILWWLVQAIVFPLSLHNMNSVRTGLLRLFGATVGKGVVIRPTARFTYPWKVAIGDYSWIGDDVVFYSLAPISLGCHCIVSQECYLCTGSHDIHDPQFKLQVAPIAIGNGAWVATDCFVASGVHIGANAVIGARSCVISDMPAGQVCHGSPCRPRRARQMREIS